MNSNSIRYLLGAGMMLLASLLPAPLRAQANASTLSGTVTDPTGGVIPNAKVSLKNVMTGATIEIQTDARGQYSIANLAAGDYELDVSALPYSNSATKTTITASANQTLNVTMAGALSLGDLGFSPDQTQGDAAAQARLDKRSHMLKIHQRLGLIATGPIVAAVIAGTGAGGKSTSSTDRYLHLALGSAAGDLYFMSALYAIRAPKIPGTEVHGQIRLHKALMWVHGPGMVLTPILGAIAFDQKSHGERVHGIASAHGPVAIVTAAAYGLAILSVSVKF